MSQLKNLLSFIINVVFPHTCIGCSKFTNHNYYTGLCIDCLKETKDFNIDLNPTVKNIVKRSYFDSFNARFIYSEKIAKAILDFKFHDSPEHGKTLAQLMRPAIEKIDNYQQCLLVPVPVHKKRLFKRKYNQASILAKHLAKQLNLTTSNDALLRIKNTPHQTGQSSKIRKQQLTNAFFANEELVKNKDIILVDDVFTTGSTANLCAQELKKKGANKVHILTVAYTQI